MKKIATLIALVFVFTTAGLAQEKTDRRIIEVSGSAERLITPDEFTFKITLNERIENKQKITIEQQEASLRDELAKLGIDVAKDLTIYDISSTYLRQKKIKDVLGTKDFRLKLRDLNKIAQLQDLADRLNVGRLDLIETESSEITKHRKETKIEAIKAAKAKAEYLLEAVGQHIGKAVYIQEVTEETPRAPLSFGLLNAQSNTTRTTGGNYDKDDSSLSFSQIKIRYAVIARFEIE